MNVAEFLTARLDEDEVGAEAAHGRLWEWAGNHWRSSERSDGRWTAMADWSHAEARVEGDNITIYDEGGHSLQQAAHIARHDPARVLREVAAMRAIMAAHELEPAHDVWGVEVGGLGCPKCDYEVALDLGGDEILRSDGCQTLRALASVYADHPDYPAPRPSQMPE